MYIKFVTIKHHAFRLSTFIELSCTCLEPSEATIFMYKINYSWSTRSSDLSEYDKAITSEFLVSDLRARSFDKNYFKKYHDLTMHIPAWSIFWS